MSPVTRHFCELKCNKGKLQSGDFPVELRMVWGMTLLVLTSIILECRTFLLIIDFVDNILLRDMSGWRTSGGEAG